MKNSDTRESDEPTADVTNRDGQTVGRQSGRLTRPVVAEILQVSVATVRRLEGSLLHPQRDQDGAYVFAPAEVQDVARKRPPTSRRHESTSGQVAAAAFALFKQGIGPADAVIELEVPPEEMGRLHSQWERLNNRLILSEATLEALTQMAAARLIDYDLVNVS